MIEGHFRKFDGVLVIAPNMSESHVEVNTEINSLDTGQADRDKHLMTADFFDADKFPKMKFISKAFSGTANGLKILGNLTIKGTTKDVVFEAKLSKEVLDMSNKKRIAITGKTKINRDVFGLGWNKIIEGIPLVGNEVTILISVEAVKA